MGHQNSWVIKIVIVFLFNPAFPWGRNQNPAQAFENDRSLCGYKDACT